MPLETDNLTFCRDIVLRRTVSGGATARSKRAMCRGSFHWHWLSPKQKTHTKATWGRTPRRRAESNNHDKTVGQRSCARKCKFCNKTHVIKKELCPAGGKTCDACKGRNHFRGSTQCSKTVHGVQNDCDSDSSSTSYGDISSVTADVHTFSSDDHGPIFCHMLIRKQSVEMQIDCGSTVSILPKKYVEDKDIRPESVTLKMWNNIKTEALGQVPC